AKTAFGAHPVFAVTCFQQGPYLTVSQSMFDPVISECVAVIPRQSVFGAEPEEASRIEDDLVDRVLRQTVGGGVGLDGQPFGNRIAEADKENAQCPTSSPTHSIGSKAKHGN